MKTVATILIPLIVYCLGYVAYYTILPDYASKYYGKQLSDNIDDDDKIRMLLKDVSHLIVAYPKDSQLRRLRISMYGLLSDQQSMKEDVYALAELEPLSPYALMNKCLYKEGMYGNNDETIQCYRNVMSLFERKELIFHPQKEKNFVYVLAALLGETKNAEDIKQYYINILGDSVIDAMNRKFLLRFKREHLFDKNPSFELF